MSVIEASSQEEVKELATIKILDLGIVAEHNMPCCVYSDDQHAVLDMSKGVFKPSRKAQAEGWQLYRIQNTKLARFLVRHLGMYIFGDKGHV